MKKSTVIKFVVALIVVMIIFWITLNYLKNRNNETIKELEYNYFVLFQNEKMGVIDRDANIIIEPNYNNIIIPNPEKDVFVCSTNESNIFLNKNSEKLFENFEEVSVIEITGLILDVPYEKEVLRFKESEKYGLIDYSGNIVLEANYDEITGLPYKSSELKVKKENKYGVVTSEGKEIINPEYDYVEGDKYYNEKNNNSGYIVGIKNNDGYKYGYLDKNRKQILELKYNNIERVLGVESDDVYLIAYDNGKGAIIKNKKELTDYEYQKIEKVESEEFFWVEKSEKYGVLDLQGKIVLSTEYEEAYLDGIYIFAKKEGQDYIFDLNGNKLVNIDYAKKYKTKNENYFITINEDGLYGVIDKNNNKIIDNEYAYLEYAFESYFIVSNQEGKTGVINEDNNKVIEIKYDIVEKLQNGNIIQTVELESNKLELYNIKLEKIFEAENTQINIRDSYIALTKGEEIKYFDLNGNEIGNIKEVTENAMPEKIGEYSKVYYSYGQVYYADLQSASE